jgi:hypothetical protein
MVNYHYCIRPVCAMRCPSRRPTPTPQAGAHTHSAQALLASDEALGGRVVPGPGDVMAPPMHLSLSFLY